MRSKTMASKILFPYTYLKKKKKRPQGFLAIKPNSNRVKETKHGSAAAHLYHNVPKKD